MEIKFDKFLNEYGGPGKAVGFRYSKPTIDYEFSINAVINRKKLTPFKVKTTIAKIFKEAKVEEDSINFNHVGADEYKLTINMKGYSKFELLSMTDFLFKKVKDELQEDIKFILDSMNVLGSDLNDTEQQKPIGFFPDKSDKSDDIKQQKPIGFKKEK